MAARFLCLLLALMLSLSGCASPKTEAAISEGGGGDRADTPAPTALYTITEGTKDVPASAPTAAAAKKKTAAQKTGAKKKKTYQAPDFAGSAFHAEAAQGTGDVLLDLSQVAQGYVAVAAWSPARLKFQTVKDGSAYTYDIASDGTPSIFPLQSGDGLYSFRVMENVTGSEYAQLYAAEAQVAMESQFAPFLRPSAYVSYSKTSACVKKAAKLAKKSGDAVEFISAVYSYICGAVDYDYPKAASVQSGYLPDPDETMETGMGICFDYASLAAAMLRSQGIPTKVIFGYVSPDGLYHAWNMFYTEQTGWVAVGFQAKKGEWTRMDLTFAANGADSSFIGDGGNYMDVYCY